MYAMQVNEAWAVRAKRYSQLLGRISNHCWRVKRRASTPVDTSVCRHSNLVLSRLASSLLDAQLNRLPPSVACKKICDAGNEPGSENTEIDFR